MSTDHIGIAKRLGDSGIFYRVQLTHLFGDDLEQTGTREHPSLEIRVFREPGARGSNIHSRRIWKGYHGYGDERMEVPWRAILQALETPPEDLPLYLLSLEEGDSEASPYSTEDFSEYVSYLIVKARLEGRL